MGPPPSVTGISPKEGPPGTRVTIRGEYLGREPNDVIGLLICGSDCLLSAEWKSSNKIIARSGPGKGRGDILITTKSGGRGTCTVQFRGYHETIGPLKESAVWVEEAPLPGLSWGHRSLSHSTYHLEDPLGLSVEEHEKKFPEDDLHEMFPERSGDLTAENFEPNWFLLEHHHATSFDDLKVGLSYLKRKVEGQKEGQLSFLKDNVSSVMEQMDTLFILKDKFAEDQKKQNDDSITKIENSINDSFNEANKLFEDVLSRREKADATRQALAVMTRYKFLFFLPMNIEHNIKHGDFDLVMSDYARARNLFGKFETRVFTQVLSEVESIIQNLKVSLRSKLEDMPATLEQQKKIIRNLVILGVEGDPGWVAITKTYSYIQEQLHENRKKHIAAENAQLDAETSKHKTDAMADTYRKLSVNLLPDLQNCSPPRVAFIENIVELMLQMFPEFLKLGQAYFNGELQIKPDRNKQTEFKTFAVSVVKLVCSLVRTSILPQNIDKDLQWPHHSSSKQSSINEIISLWLPHCIRLVQTLYSSLIALDISHESLEMVSKLLLDLRIHSMIIQLKKTADQVKSLESKENWCLEFDAEFGAITQLPGEFEKLVTDSVQRIKESALETERKELSVLTNSTAKQELTSLTNKIFLNFVQTLEFLGMISEDHDHAVAVSQLIGSPTPYSENSSTELTWEQRLLAMLSNCRYTRIVLYPKLSALFRHHGFPSIEEPVEQCSAALSTLENRMTETYVELKSDPLVGTVEPSMYLGHFEWDTCTKPNDLRPYAKEILTNITAVYAEVHRLVPKLLFHIISQIVETVAEELSRLMSCVTKFNNYGKIQARIDITGLQRVLHQFMTDNAKCFFDEALDVVSPITNSENSIIEEVLTNFLKKMSLQLSCFTAVRPTKD
ncbi:hypothetical protein V9T40_010256 [Parthenolecanium corni]|uniref:Exocyst complex component 2 n=1 Tax=Parthenolecanium corni TaxID=536013 RepID=A0AAN9Y030_9HEMI